MSNSDDKQRNSLYHERATQARIVRRIVFFAFLGLVILGTIAGFGAYSYITNALSPVDEDSPEEMEITIPIGSTANHIGTILEEEGLVRNGTVFRYYVRYKNESGFQAGDYRLHTGMTMDEIIESLKDGTVMQDPELVFTIPEGLWLERMIEVIAKETDHTVEDLEAVIHDKDYVESLIERYDMLTEVVLDENIRYPLEGYLFPARYDFMVENPSIEEIVEAMLSRTQAILTNLEEEMDELELTPHEVLTLASIIEREAQKSEDRYMISGVLHTRLERGMKLEVDPTTAYAIGEHLYMTSLTDTRFESPYNTYVVEGIPIGPIAGPGQDSIEAVVRPEITGDLYFYARINGDVLYTDTYEEHLANRDRYRHEWIEAAEQAEQEDEE
ncbi:endolytic transglycosylase MltG [Halalkalibacter sp. APA_J-10(15)]|uniref:endolytic transglycosylase MltG n=1 Tax=Halalkalibacter sp. APA_J-10(15) TaxID=2933805 RepID=UPI001FF306B7|nr:endolytic transglycosylase MltG [Halalkalibacter sp. APA_J-10(15)]MCK0470921.1 endolytic transglycosylase MltG [Halalkalibacter sp. APA_J-10(15)]